jgi:hypothetical protein
MDHTVFYELDDASLGYLRVNAADVPAGVIDTITRPPWDEHLAWYAGRMQVEHGELRYWSAVAMLRDWSRGATRAQLWQCYGSQGTVAPTAWDSAPNEDDDWDEEELQTWWNDWVGEIQAYADDAHADFATNLMMLALNEPIGAAAIGTDHDLAHATMHSWPVDYASIEVPQLVDEYLSGGDDSDEESSEDEADPLADLDPDEIRQKNHDILKNAQEPGQMIRFFQMGTQLILLDHDADPELVGALSDEVDNGGAIIGTILIQHRGNLLGTDPGRISVVGVDNQADQQRFHDAVRAFPSRKKIDFTNGVVDIENASPPKKGARPPSTVQEMWDSPTWARAYHDWAKQWFVDTEMDCLREIQTFGLAPNPGKAQAIFDTFLRRGAPRKVDPADLGNSVLSDINDRWDEMDPTHPKLFDDVAELLMSAIAGNYEQFRAEYQPR